MKKELKKKISKVYDELMKDKKLNVNLIMDYDGLRVEYYKDIKTHTINPGTEEIIGINKSDLMLIGYNKEKFINSILQLFEL